MEYSGFFVTQFGGDSIEELFEVDFSSERFEIGDHVEDGRVFAFEAQALHCGFELSGVDLASGFGVEQVEGLSEFFDFVFSESGS